MAMLFTVLAVLEDYEKNGRYSGVVVKFSRGAYYDAEVGPNWWNYFFEPLEAGLATGSSYKTLNDKELSKYGHWGLDNLTRKRSFELIQKYFYLLPHIQEKVSALNEELFEGKYIIGVHYRGTDKVKSRRISYQEVAANINKVIAQNKNLHQGDYKIFIATDEDAFLDYMEANYTCPLVYLNVIRSSNGTPVHLNGSYSSNYQKGEDALIDSILLSQCDTLIRTDSNLSYWSTMLNPEMPVLFLR
jgi:hypothetical protein